jgi:Predicted membrane protein/domain
MEQPTQDLLQEYETELYLEPVSPGLRFLNYLIDLIVFYILMIGAGALWGISLASKSLSAYEAQQEVERFTGLVYLFSFGTMLAYYIIFEGASKGRTLGKLITGTVAVKEDGSPIGFKEALIRTLCRLIPFEPFSTFGGRPWHDRFAKTWVIKKRR